MILERSRFYQKKDKGMRRGFSLVSQCFKVVLKLQCTSVTVIDCSSSLIRYRIARRPKAVQIRIVDLVS